MDLVYYESPPGLQLLHCARFDAAAAGGESLFMDGLAAARDFAAAHRAAFDALARLPTTFQKVHYARDTPAHIVARRPIFAVDAYLTARAGAGAPPVVTGLFWAPPFEGPLALDASDHAEYYAAYAAWAQFLRAREADGASLIEFRLAEGDVAVFVQRRILHGRRAIAGGGERVLHGAYVGIDEFKSRCEHAAAVHGGRTFAVGNGQPT
jgi:gamma-butyrobetaine dioxygenase